MKKITEKQLTDLLEEGELCDGTYCEDAKDNYVECNDLEYEED